MFSFILYFYLEPQTVAESRKEISQTTKTSKTVARLGFLTRKDQFNAVLFLRKFSSTHHWRVSDLGIRKITFVVKDDFIKIISILLLSGDFKKLDDNGEYLFPILVWMDNQGPHTAVKCRLIDMKKSLFRSGKSQVFTVSVFYFK